MFQFVSPKAHFQPMESSEKPIIGSLQEQWRIHKENGAPLVLGGRFEVTSINPARPRERLADGMEPHEDDVRLECQLTVIDLQDSNREMRTIPLTQVGLKFKDKCLRANQIAQAYHILEDHQKRYASLHTLSDSEPQALPMIASRAGRGRGPTLIVYSEIVGQIEAGIITEKGALDKALVDVINEGRKSRITADMLHSREPDLNGFVHSERQISELRQALEEYLRNKTPQDVAVSGDVDGTWHGVNRESNANTPLKAAESEEGELNSAATSEETPLLDRASAAQVIQRGNAAESHRQVTQSERNTAHVSGNVDNQEPVQLPPLNKIPRNQFVDGIDHNKQNSGSGCAPAAAPVPASASVNLFTSIWAIYERVKSVYVTNSQPVANTATNFSTTAENRAISARESPVPGSNATAQHDQMCNLNEPGTPPLLPPASTTATEPAAAQTASALSSNCTASEKNVRAFFHRQPEGGTALTINTVLNYSFNEIERNHQFIQWLFPTDERSRFNPDAPVLTGQEFLALRNDAEIKQGVEDGFERMLDFYGLVRNGDQIEIDPKQSEHHRNFLKNQSHHQLRLTRIMRSLSLLGKQDDATALFQCMQRTVDTMPAGMKAEWSKSVHFWRNALHQPVLVSDISNDRATYFFPNKLLLEAELAGTGAPQNTLQQLHPGGHVNELYALQSGLYTRSGKSNIDAPLKAHFSKSKSGDTELVPAYFEKELDQTQIEQFKNCKVSTAASYYFPNTPEAPTQTGSHQADDTYEIHVDFANRSFGGAWKTGIGAQEEDAFAENAGLGAVAQYAGVFANKDESLNPSGAVLIRNNGSQLRSRILGDTFVTRQEKAPVSQKLSEKECDGVPRPIVIENCVRVCTLVGPRGNKRAEGIRPVLTNWLAIAAPDLRHQRFLNRYDGDDRLIVDNEHAMQLAEKYAKSKEVFADIFRTAYEGFNMAGEVAEGKRLNIHTGLLGCGVFKNEPAISIAAQMLAAKVLGVEAIKFYDIRPTENEKFNAIKQVVDDCINGVASPASINALVEDLFNRIHSDEKWEQLSISRP